MNEVTFQRWNKRAKWAGKAIGYCILRMLEGVVLLVFFVILHELVHHAGGG